MYVQRVPMAPASQEVLNLKYHKSVTVTVERLDTYAQTQHLPAPDLIKLDVQGFECEVLKGGAKSLEHVIAVIAEVSFKELYKDQCRFDQSVSLLAEAGLFVSAFGAKTAVGRPLNQCDMLFLRPNGVAEFDG
jgi:hypothetical protein